MKIIDERETHKKKKKEKDKQTMTEKNKGRDINHSESVRAK